MNKIRRYFLKKEKLIEEDLTRFSFLTYWGSNLARHSFSEGGSADMKKKLMVYSHQSKKWVKRILFLAFLGLAITAFNIFGLPYFQKKPAPVHADSLLKFDEGYASTVHDSSGSASGTITSATWQPEDLCLSGKCLYFDGSSWVSFGDDDNLDFAAATDFTIEFWFRHKTATAAETIVQKYEGTGGDGGYRIRMESDGDISFGVDDANDGFADDNITSTAANYDDNRWHHVTAVKNDTTGIYLFIDGVQVASDETIGSTATLANDDTLYLGDSDGTDNSDEYIGFLDEVKIYTSSARTATEIKADIAGQTPNRGTSTSFGLALPAGALSEGLIGYWKMNESSWNGSPNEVIDSSGNNAHGTSSCTGGGCTVTTTAVAKFDMGGNFDGADDMVTVSTNSIFDLTQAVTISAWVNPNAGYGETAPRIFDRQNYVVNIDPATGRTYFYIYVGGSPYSTSTPSGITEGDWTLITATFDNSLSQNQLKIYANGVLVDQTTQTGPIDSTAGETIYIGDSGYGSRVFDGKIDDLRIYNRALSPAEVASLYNWAPNPVGYWKFDEGSGTTYAYDTSGNAYHLDLTSIANTDWQAGKLGHGLSFDGSSDYATATPENGAFSSNIYSVSTWVYRNTDSGGIEKIADNQDSDNDGWSLLISASDLPTCSYNSTDVAATTSISTSTWYHLGCTSDGSTLKVYVNGIMENSTALSGNISESTDLRVAAQSYGTSEKFAGIIDDLKVYKYARTPAQIVQDMNAGHPAPGSPIGSPIGYWKFDNPSGDTVYDSSPSSNDLASGGGGSSNLATADGKYGLSQDCNGATCAFSRSTDDEMYDIDDGDTFTFTGWFNRESSSTDDTIIAKRNGDSTSDKGWMIWIDDATDKLTFEICDSTVPCDEYMMESSTTFTSSGWYYFAVVYDDNSASNSKIYINGVDDNETHTGTLTNIDSANNTTDLQLFSESDNGNPFDGRLDEIKVFDFALTQSQILVDMNRGSAASMGNIADTEEEGFSLTLPTGQWEFNEKTGQSVYNKGTAQGANLDLGTSQSVEATDPDWVTPPKPDFYTNGVAGSALQFDGSQDTVEADDNSDFNIGDTQDFSISAWVYRLSSGSDHVIVSKHPGTAGLTSAGYILWIDNTNDIRVDYADGSALTIDSSGTIASTGWHHIVAVYDDDNDANTTLYIDGFPDEESQSASVSTIASMSNTRNFRIGSNGANTPGENFDGYIDNVRFFNYALTQAQISWLYNRGKPLGWWKLDDNVSGDNKTVYDSSGNGNNGTTSDGDATLNCTVDGKHNLACDFDGNDDYIYIADDTNLRFDSSAQDFSLFGWINRAATGANHTVVAKEEADNDGWRLLLTSSDTVQCSVNSIDVTSTSTITDSNWHHVGCTIDRDGNGQVYIDGQADGNTAAISSTAMATTSTIRIGTNSLGTPTNYFSGQIDEVKIFNYALTAQQVKTLYNDGSVSFLPITGTPQ